MMNKVLLSIMAMFSLVFSTACGQDNNKTEKAAAVDNKRLTSDILQQSTSIQFFTNNGTVAPDYHYNMTVVVTKDSVTLTVIKGYGNKAAYDQTAPLTAEQYQQFIQQLAALSVHNTDDEPIPTTGGPVESIRVLDGSKLLFGGSTGRSLTYDGDLSITFHDVLPNEMAQVFRHPLDL